MRGILRADGYKLKKNKLFWLCLLFSFVMGIVLVGASYMEMQEELLAAPAAGSAEYGEYLNAVSMAEGASGIWAVEYGLGLGLLPILSGTFIAWFTASEFSYGTMKNTLGISRRQIFLSKCIVNSVASILSLLFFMAGCWLAGTIIWGADPQGVGSFFSIVGMVLLQIFLIVAYGLFFTCNAVWIRSSSGSMAINILCGTGLTYVLSALNLLFGGKVDLNHYWIGGAMGKLATVTPLSADVYRGLWAGVVWGGLFLALGVIAMRKKDIR